MMVTGNTAHTNCPSLPPPTIFSSKWKPVYLLWFIQSNDFIIKWLSCDQYYSCSLPVSSDLVVQWLNRYSAQWSQSQFSMLTALCCCNLDNEMKEQHQHQQWITVYKDFETVGPAMFCLSDNIIQIHHKQLHVSPNLDTEHCYMVWLLYCMI